MTRFSKTKKPLWEKIAKEANAMCPWRKNSIQGPYSAVYCYHVYNRMDSVNIKLKAVLNRIVPKYIKREDE